MMRKSPAMLSQDSELEIIESTKNPFIKRIRSIKSRKGRKKERAFWVEGLAPTLEALQSDWDVENIVRCPSLLSSEDASSLIEGAAPHIKDLSLIHI